jgi:hypothetical protein
MSLVVEHEHPKVRHLYERWGYTFIGTRQPVPDAPILDVMNLNSSRT